MLVIRRGCLLLFLLLFLAATSHGEVVCPKTCRCGPEEVVCENNRTMRELPGVLPSNDTLRTLTVTRVNITTVTSAGFSHLRNLTSLYLHNNRIETLADGAFQPLSQLETLVMRRNFLKQLSEQTFSGLHGLKKLDMSWNCFVELNSRWFQNLTSLEALDLTRNEIEHIEGEAFMGLANLHVLNLTRNKLITVSNKYLAPLISLQDLVVDDNSLRFIEADSFSSQVALTRLSLTGNRDLKSVQSNAFVSQSRVLPLEELSLKGTHLMEVPVGMLKSLPALKTLDLSQTAISVVRGWSFSAQSNLLNLTLDSLPNLSVIEDHAFTGLTRLETLVITNNQMLSNISWGAFRNLSSLRYLDLHKNGLETLRSKQADWQNIEVVDLRGNPLRCDCHASWILALLKERDNSSWSGNDKFSVGLMANSTCINSSMSTDPDNRLASTTFFTRQIRCHMPPRLNGKCLASLSVRDFRCTTASIPRTKSNHDDRRLTVAVISASLTCLFLITCGLVLKFHRRLCSSCSRQYRYRAHRNHGVNGTSPSADMVDLETTQLEDFDSDIDTSVRP